jgi:predicted dehydrogenase
MLRFPSGLLAICASSYNTYGSKSFRLIGEKAWIDLDPAFPYRGQKMRVAKAAGDGSEQFIEPQIQHQNQFALEMDHMAQCVRNDRKPHTPGEEGMQDMRIIGALYEAAESGSAVKLPAADRLDAFRGPAPE